MQSILFINGQEVPQNELLITLHDSVILLPGFRRSILMQPDARSRRNCLLPRYRELPTGEESAILYNYFTDRERRGRLYWHRISECYALIADDETDDYICKDNGKQQDIGLIVKGFTFIAIAADRQ